MLWALLCCFHVSAEGSDSPRVHDPSTLVKCKDRYWFFATGPGIVSYWSKDLVNWEPGPRVFRTPPPWTSETIPGNRGYFWAPDILQHNGRYLLYYSVSTWGKNTSAIGLATNPALDPAAPNYQWTDQGIVVQSIRQDPYNAIDPSVCKDREGKLWLSFGSFWSGIKMIELDPATGKRIQTNSPVYSLASHSAIEAPCLYQQGDYYYLFVNWGLCCQGTNSTYEIRVGRSRNVTGPYLDKENRDLMQNGGTLFLQSTGRFIGPGHAGVFVENGTNWLSYHYYDGRNNGRSALAMKRLTWGKDGWPILEAK